MRISRRSVGRRRNLLKDITLTLSRVKRNGSPPSSGATKRLLLFSASLFIFSSILLLLRQPDAVISQRLRSTGTAHTRVPDSVVATLKKFNPNDFQRKHIRQPPDTSVILFYNLFIPDETEAVYHAIEVITEQLGQVAKSLQKLEKDKRKAALFYNLLGNKTAFPEEKMKKLCSELHSQLSCKQIGYYETASESVTLQDIYDFCQNEDAADTRVTYIHSKGSYHQTLVNTCWRRALTDAVVHANCLFPPDDRCNVCGAQFYTRFSTMYPGNMWTAKCSYVKKLLPPLEGGEYDKRKKESVIKMLKYRLWGQIITTLYDDRIDYFGLGRYRLEHWIGSHPDIRPCELHRTSANLQSMISGSITPDDFEWGPGPRRDDLVDENDKARSKLMEDEDAQFREYYLLPGNLLKWFTLYGSDGVPAENSWQWKFFPAGDKWKKLVDEYKENAVEEMVMQSSSSFHSAYVSDGHENEEFQIDHDDEKLFSDSTAPLVVFYHISIPNDKKLSSLRALKSQMDVLTMGQYDIISRSYHPERPVMLYYTVAGNSTNISFFTKMCEAKTNLTCRKLGEFTSTKASGETLHRLHNFCLAKPSLSVTYVSNQLPGTHGVNKTEPYSMQKIRAYTTAVTSKMCLKSRDTCNVCGSEFYPLPFNHFTGNMWTAKCSYVKDLLPPEKFERAMGESASETLVSQLRGAVTTELFPFTPQNLGLEQYSVEHWIASNPDFSPCDVAPVKRGWFPGSVLPNDYSNSRVYDFMWSQAPRRSSAPAGHQDDIAFREYYYLAGSLFRWYKLYNKAPPLNSWVWQWYPKGNEWMLGNQKYGLDVVTKFSQPFWDEGVPF